jgi:biotin transport system permease protein
MKGSYTPWAYRTGHSFLHRAPGGVKLAGLLCLSLGVFSPGRTVFPCAALLVIVLSCSAGIKPWELLRGSRPLLLFALFMFLFGAVEFHPARAPRLFTLTRGGLKAGLVFGLRIGVSFSAGALFFSVTTLGEIKKSLSRLESFVRVRVFRTKEAGAVEGPRGEQLQISLAISLMLMFLPRFFETWEEADLAWRSRAGGRGFRKLLVLTPLLLERMMTLAAETAEALESRGAKAAPRF